jgi:hypothetical protein
VIDQYVLIDYLKQMSGVKSVNIQGICPPYVCVLTDSPAVADRVNTVLLLLERTGRVSEFAVCFDLD